jgi:hypothetical protein
MSYGTTESLHILIICELTSVSMNTDKTPWPLVRKQTLPTERPPLIDEI